MKPCRIWILHNLLVPSKNTFPRHDTSSSILTFFLFLIYNEQLFVFCFLKLPLPLHLAGSSVRTLPPYRADFLESPTSLLLLLLRKQKAS